MLRACSLALPYKPVQQKQHGDSGRGEARQVEIDLGGEHDQVDKYKSVGDRQTEEAETAPQQQSLPAARIAAKQKYGTAEGHQGADDVNRSSHHPLSFLMRNARAKSRTPAEPLECIREETRT